MSKDPRFGSGAMDLTQIRSATLCLSATEYEHLCTNSTYFAAEHRFENVVCKDSIEIHVSSPTQRVKLSFVKQIILLASNPITDVDVLLSVNLHELMLVMDYFQMTGLFKKLAMIVVDDVVRVELDLINWLDAIKYTMGTDHPFMKFMVNYVYNLNKHFPLTIASNTFCCLLAKHTRRKFIRSKIRMTRNVRDFEQYPHFKCMFCDKQVVYKPIGDGEFDKVQITPCCGSPVHTTCTSLYVMGTECILCHIALERVGDIATKPCYDLEMTLHHTINRYRLKDFHDTDRQLILPPICKR